jgi:signal transduction histidine kinase/HAMP domain-containing protein
VTPVAGESPRDHASRPARSRFGWPAGITARLWSGLAAFIVLVAVAALVVFAGVRQQDKTVDHVVSDLHPLSSANIQIQADFAQAQALLRAYLLTREPRYFRLYQRSHDTLGSALRQMAGLSAQRWQSLIGEQRQAGSRWFGYAAQMLVLPPGSPGLTRLTDAAHGSAGTFYRANIRLTAVLRQASRSAITAAQAAADRATAIGGVLTALAVLLGLAGVIATLRGVTRPLRGLVRVLRRLASGDHAARAALAGPAEIQEVARSLNVLADEGDRLRDRDTESGRMREMARQVGLRIREHLRVEDLVNEARQAIERNLGADLAYLHVVQNGRLGPPVGHERDWVMPDGFLDTLENEGGRALFQAAYWRRASLVTQDLTGPEGKLIAPAIRRPLLAAGIVSQVLAPFGSGSELLGIMAVIRTHPGHPWSAAEVAAIESIAADLGGGLHHARLYEAENRLVDELRRVDQAKSDFLATVSHELRTPLTSIAGYVEILRDAGAGPLTPAQDQMLETVDRNAARLRHLIEDVLTLSKIESGAFKTGKKPVDLTDVITSAVAALQPAAAAKGLTVSAGEPASSLVVAGDSGQLDRLVMNLLSNAVKFTPEGGQVSVDIGSNGSMAVLDVTDTGIGIPEGDQKELFNRFFRATNAVERSIPGTGLGLAIVRTIVANHGGDLDVRSRESDGTCVRVRIPLLAPGRPRRPAQVPAAGGGHPA